MKKFVLASASPRRSEILKNAGFDFSVDPADVDESVPEGLQPEEYVKYLAITKANAVAARHRGAAIVSADTIVVLDGKILGKPHDRADARKMLCMLSGKSHSVFTGFCILEGTTERAYCCETIVKFYTLTYEIIENYLASGESMDKAGSYGIQGLGCLLVEKIDGDYFNVVGFPVSLFNQVF